MAHRIDLLRRLAARYWQPFASGVAAIYGTAAALSVYWSGIPLSPGTHGAKLTVVAASVAVLVIIRHPALAYAVMRLLVPPGPVPESRRGFRGLLAYTRGEKIPGRTYDVAQCGLLLGRSAFVVLDGETGCGKTSVLRAALLPLMEDSVQVVEARLTGDPFGALFRALAPGTELPARVGREQILSILRQPQAIHPSRPRLIVIDQFEELFALVRDEVRIRFATLLRELVKGGYVRVLVAIRSDFLAPLVHLCADVDPDRETLNLSAWHTLKAFREGVAAEVVAEILGDIADEDALLEQDVQSLARTLAKDLLRPPRDVRLSPADPWTVLPAELQAVGYTLQLTGAHNLSVDGYRRANGRAGLMRAFIEDTRRYVYLSSGVEGETMLLVLRALGSPAGTRRQRTVRDLQAENGLSSLSRPQLEAVLRALEHQLLVQRVSEQADGPGAWEVRYELVHEYLMQILYDTPDPVLQRARDADERLRFWLSRTRGREQPRRRITRLFDQPVPLIETLVLRGFAGSGESRQMLNASLRGFAARVSAALLLCAAAGLAVSVWWNSDRHQVELAAREGTAIAIKMDPDSSSIRWMIALAEIGRVQDAIRVANSMETNYIAPFQRTDALFATADTLLQRGNLRTAGALVEAALAGKNHAAREGGTSALTRVALALAREGRPAEAGRLPLHAQGARIRGHAYVDVAEVLAGEGYATAAVDALHKARNAVSAAPDPVGRVQVLARTTQAALRAQQRAEAAAAADELWTALWAMPQVLRYETPAAAAAFARAGETERAKRTIRLALLSGSLEYVAYDDEELLDSTFADLARAGQTSWILSTLRAARSPAWDRGRLSENFTSPLFFEAAARGLARAGEVDSAFVIIVFSSSAQWRAETTVEIGEAILSDPRHAARARSVLIATDRFLRSEAAAARLSRNQHDALADRVAAGLLRAGDRTRAFDIIWQTARASRGAGDEANFDTLLSYYTKRGVLDSATILVQTVSDPEDQCRIALNAARSVASRGVQAARVAILRLCMARIIQERDSIRADTSAAFRAGLTRPIPFNGSIRSELIAALMVSGVPGGSPVLDSIADSFAGVDTDTVVAKAVALLSDSGQFAKARDLMSQIRNERYRTWAWGSMAVALANADSGVAALDLEQRIDPETFPIARSRSCGAIAAWHARTGRIRQARRIARLCPLPEDVLRGYGAMLSAYARSGGGTPSRTDPTNRSSFVR